jgi:hypothetical protein
MKLHKFRLRVTTLLCGLASFALSSFAADHPLNFPYGLAVDGSGNLYVANMNGNQVLVYNSSHVQLAAKTIANNIAGPTGVAFAWNGNLWLTDATSSLVAEYGPNGVFIGGITDGVSNPEAIAIDGLNEVLVNNAYQTLSLFPQDSLQRFYSPLYSYTIPSPNAITGLASARACLRSAPTRRLFYLLSVRFFEIRALEFPFPQPVLPRRSKLPAASTAETKRNAHRQRPRKADGQAGGSPVLSSRHGDR